MMLNVIEFHQTELMMLQCWEGFCAPSNLSKLPNPTTLAQPLGITRKLADHSPENAGTSDTFTGFLMYMYHKNQPNVGKYIPYMDGMGLTIRVSFVVIPKLKSILRWSTVSFPWGQLSEFRVLSPRTVRETGEVPQEYRMFQPVED